MGKLELYFITKRKKDKEITLYKGYSGDEVEKIRIKTKGDVTIRSFKQGLGSFKIDVRNSTYHNSSQIGETKYTLDLIDLKVLIFEGLEKLIRSG